MGQFGVIFLSNHIEMMEVVGYTNFSVTQVHVLSLKSELCPQTDPDLKLNMNFFSESIYNKLISIVLGSFYMKTFKKKEVLKDVFSEDLRMTRDKLVGILVLVTT